MKINKQDLLPYYQGEGQLINQPLVDYFQEERPVLNQSAEEKVAEEEKALSFKVTNNQDVFHYQSVNKKIARVVYLIFSILLPPLGIFRLLAYAINRFFTKNFILPSLNKPQEYWSNDLFYHTQEVIVETIDRVKLQALYMQSKVQIIFPREDRQCILYFNDKDSPYEEIANELEVLCKDLNVDVYCGNYRGVGKSEGFPSSYQDLVMDGEAMLQHLLHLGYKEENILIHGSRSLGSGIGAKVASLHQEVGREVHFCSDRSSSSLMIEVKERFKDLKARVRLPGQVLIEGFIIGLIKAFRWNTKTLDAYQKIRGHKFIFFHREDPIIPYQASLYKQLKDSLMTIEDIKQKQQRTLLKHERKDQLRVFARNPRPYRPHDVICIDNTDARGYMKHPHYVSITKVPQYKEYKNYVNNAFDRMQEVD